MGGALLSVFCCPTVLLAARRIPRHRNAKVFLMSVVNNFIFFAFSLG
jgi:hypothetical protein